MPLTDHPTGADLLVHGTYVLRLALDRIARPRPAPPARLDDRRPLVTARRGRLAPDRPSGHLRHWGDGAHGA